MELTIKEQKAFQAIVDNALEGMGGNEPKDLHDDNYSWFKRQDITERTGFNKHEASGLMASLMEKGLIYEADTPLWAMTEEGIDVAQEIYETPNADGFTQQQIWEMENHNRSCPQ